MDATNLHDDMMGEDISIPLTQADPTPSPASSSSTDDVKKEKVFFFLYVDNKLEELVNTTVPQRIRGQALYFNIVNQYLEYSKFAVIYRSAVERVRRVPDSDERKAPALAALCGVDGQKYNEMLQTMAFNAKKQKLIRDFVCDYYEIPRPSDDEILFEESDDIYLIMQQNVPMVKEIDELNEKNLNAIKVTKRSH